MRLEDVNQFLQGQLTHVKLHAQELLTARTVEIERKNWEIFANEVKAGFMEDSFAQFSGPDLEGRNQDAYFRCKQECHSSDADKTHSGTLGLSPSDTFEGISAYCDSLSESRRNKHICRAELAGRNLFTQAVADAGTLDVANIRSTRNMQTVDRREPYNTCDEDSCESNELASFCKSCAFEHLAKAKKYTRQQIQLSSCDSENVGEGGFLNLSASSRISHGNAHHISSYSETDVNTQSHKSMTTSYLDEFIQLQREIQKLGLQQYASSYKQIKISGLERDVET